MEFVVYVVGIIAVVVVAVLFRRPEEKEPESERYAQGGVVRTDFRLSGVKFLPNECIIRQDMECARGEDPMHNPDDAPNIHARFWYCARYTGLQPTPEQARSWREDRLREMNRRTET